MKNYEMDVKNIKIFKEVIDLMLTKDIAVSDAIDIFKDCAEKLPEYVKINNNK